LKERPQGSRQWSTIWAIEIDDREDYENQVQEEDSGQYDVHEIHHEIVDRQQECNQSSKEKEQGSMQKEGDHIKNGVHPKVLQSKIEE
jgi:hypothetical protein